MSDTRYLPKEVLVRFIEEYRHHPALWKMKSREYSNKNLKNVGYEALIKICKDVEPNANKEFVTKKIQSIRGSFRKELKKIESSSRSGAGADEVYVPTLWYFEFLKFTIDQEQPTDSISNISSPSNIGNVEGEEGSKETEDTEVSHSQYTNDDENEIENEEQESNLRTSTSSKLIPRSQSKRRKKNERDDIQIFMKACTDALKAPNEVMGGFDAVASKLKRMEPRQQVFAETLIQKIL